MGKIFFILAFVSSVMGYSQSGVVPLTPESLYEKIKAQQRPAVVQFWVPVCEDPIKLIKDYQKFVDEYGKNIDFYFVGITNKEEMISDLMEETKASFTPYMIDKNLLEDIYKRFPFFTNGFSKLATGKSKHFITAYIPKKISKTKLTEDIDLNTKELQKLNRP